jgi:hypothetical protein
MPTPGVHKTVQARAHRIESKISLFFVSSAHRSDDNASLVATDGPGTVVVLEDAEREYSDRLLAGELLPELLVPDAGEIAASDCRLSFNR